MTRVFGRLSFAVLEALAPSDFSPTPDDRGIEDLLVERRYTGGLNSYSSRADPPRLAILHGGTHTQPMS